MILPVMDFLPNESRRAVNAVRAKRRVALLTALADLGGVWPVMQVTRALTDFADRCVQLCVTHLIADEERRSKMALARGYV